MVRFHGNRLAKTSSFDVVGRFGNVALVERAWWTWFVGHVVKRSKKQD